MPLFGAPSQAEKLFKQAKHYLNPKKREFDLDLAIRYLKDALVLEPDKRKYRQELGRAYLMKLAEKSASEPSQRIELYKSVLEAILLREDDRIFLGFQPDEPDAVIDSGVSIERGSTAKGGLVINVASEGELDSKAEEAVFNSVMVLNISHERVLSKTVIETLQSSGFNPVKKNSKTYQKHFEMSISPSNISPLLEWCFREVLQCPVSYTVAVLYIP